MPRNKLFVSLWQNKATMESIIGRKKEQKELERIYNSNKAEFVVVYGRRRVGKTYLVREYFQDRLDFYHTALSPIELGDESLAEKQLQAFYHSLKRYGAVDIEKKPADWFEAFEMLDHFRAYEFLFNQPETPLNENLLKETHRILMEHTLSYRYPEAKAGEYTDTDMCAGDTIFGEHEQLISRVPQLLSSTQRTMEEGKIHPIILSARFHGFYEYLHPFRDGNGRIGRLFSNFILHKAGHPIVIITYEKKDEYINALRHIRTERTDEHLISFFFQTAIERMQREIDEKKKQSIIFPFLF